MSIELKELQHELQHDLQDIVLHALEEIKAVNVSVLNVGEMTSITEYMVVATGTSTRHVKAIAEAVIKRAKNNAMQPLGVEGEKESEWVLIDLGDIIVHIMQAESREFYQLEKLWSYH